MRGAGWVESGSSVAYGWVESGSSVAYGDGQEGCRGRQKCG